MTTTHFDLIKFSNMSSVLATTIANNRKRIRNQVLKRRSSFVKIRKVGFISDVTVGEFLEHFIYTKSSEWSTQFPDSNGQNQSPINLVSKTAVYDPKFKEKLLSISYSSSRETDFLNNGQTVVIYPKSRNDTSVRQEQAVRSVITGGPLDDDEYELAEIRFHWGRCSGRGSEHTVNGKAFPMELQFIHWNSTLYQNLEEATGKDNGIAAICLFVQIGRENPAFKALIADSLDDILYKGRQKTTYAPFNPASLLPVSELLQDYWVYDGSLTHPPCSENVTWILLRYPLLLSQEQAMDFRRLNTYSQETKVTNAYEGKLVDNFRPIQPLNGRKIRASFQ
ncbi:carbonic anhydrase-related protein-like isoform X2 [Mytilus trossulus]|uniref:carbonic anhydrase-related protein-like isoform X2 n=1 Tax=Mytilus trossulus TaxID=6551 RepID=UPI003007229E